MTVGELIDHGSGDDTVSGCAMRWKPGSVLDLIDSALADCTSDDAMRWAPDLPSAESYDEPTWTDISTYVRGLEPCPSRPPSAARVTFTLDNASARFTPAVGASPVFEWIADVADELSLDAWQVDVVERIFSSDYPFRVEYRSRRGGRQRAVASTTADLVVLDEMLTARNAKLARIRRMHCEYHRRQRRRRS